jgi:hypothetical protein
VIGNSRKLDHLAEQNAAEHVALTDRIDAIQTEVRRWHASKEKPQ